MAEITNVDLGGDKQTKGLRDRLRDYYAPEDFVTVQNIDSEPLSYQFQSPQHQEFVSSAPHIGETYNVKPPQIVKLAPGETRLCPAYEADLMLENLIKKLALKKTDKSVSAGSAVRWQSTDWNDPQLHKEILKDAFLGKQDLLQRYNQEDNDEPVKEPARIGRPPKQAPAA